MLGKLINFEGFCKKRTGKVINLKFESSTILLRWIIGKNFKFMLFEDSSILGGLFKLPRHLPFHNRKGSSSIIVAYRVYN